MKKREKKENKINKGDRRDKGGKGSDKREELKKKLEECSQQKERYLKGWQCQRADFLNYKKKEIERIQELVKYANTGLVMKLFPILDSFHLAEKNLPSKLKEDDNVQGFLQIRKKIEELLKKEGIEEIECEGEKFDPQFHEVVEAVSPQNNDVSERKDASGTIIEEVQKGYKENGRVLRPAKVKVIK